MLRLLAFWVLLGALVACGRAEAPSEEAEERAGAGTVALTASAPGGGAVHIVRMIARGDRYAFEPAEVHVRAGDVVRFVQTDHQPEAVAFDSTAAPPGGAEFLGQHGLLRGPLLTEPGVFFDVPFRDAPAGAYPYFSVPHRQLGMEGRIIVED